MAFYFYLTYATFILIHFFTTIQSVSYINPDDVKNNLGFAFEFKIHVDAGREECFFQDIHQHSTLYVAFQVMRGGDAKAGFAVRNPAGVVVLPYQWQANAEYEEETVKIGGFFQFCIDNSLSRFASKLVSLYVASYKRDEWEKYIGELTDIDVTVTNFTNSLQTVDHNIGSMLKSLDQSRRQMSHDWYLTSGNNKYVQYWSITQCIAIILSSVIQVYFVRKLFGVDADSKKLGVKGPRPRA